MFTWGSNASQPEKESPRPSPEVEEATAVRTGPGLDDGPRPKAPGRSVALPEDDVSLSAPAPVRVPGAGLSVPAEAAETPVQAAAVAVPPPAPLPVAGPTAAPVVEVAAGDGYELADLLTRMEGSNASDLHLNVGSPPVYRIAGKLSRSAGPALTREMARTLLLPLMRPDHLERFKVTGSYDFAYELPEVARFRAHFFGQHYGLGAVFHRLPWRVPSLQELSLPESLQNLAQLRAGLVIATGPARSGRSTTIAAMIDHINHNRCEHVVTLEQPVEYYHESDTCLIDHREIGLHANSLADGLQAALHEHPDVLVLPELKDRESVSGALRAVESGMLVFATMSSGTVVETLERLSGFYAEADQARARSWLAMALKGLLSHHLIQTRPKTVLALEILTSDRNTVRAIREGRFEDLPALMQQGRKEGMQTLDQALADLVTADRLDRRVARRLASDAAVIPD